MTGKASGQFRVIYHPALCPDCGCDHITTEEVQATDGLAEMAHICRDCGAAWPIACIAEHLQTAPAEMPAGKAGALHADPSVWEVA